MAQLTPAERARGVLAVSAGNHAQAVAYHASGWASRRRSSCRASRRAVKVENTRGFGAEVVLDGDTFEDARVARPGARARSAATRSSIRSTTSR